MKLKQIILWNILLLFLLSPCFSKEKDAILEIKWNKITPYEYLGYIEEDCYILDLYEDFIEAKIKEDESKYDFYKIENNYLKSRHSFLSAFIFKNIRRRSKYEENFWIRL